MTTVRARVWWSAAAALSAAVGLVVAVIPARAAVDPGSGGDLTGPVAVRPGPVSVPVSVQVPGLRVRSDPGLDGVVEGLLYRPDRVEIVSEGPVEGGYAWELVKLAASSAGGLPKGWIGWVASRYVQTPDCPADGSWVPWECALVPDPLPPLRPGMLLAGGAGHGLR